MARNRFLRLLNSTKLSNSLVSWSRYVRRIRGLTSPARLVDAQNPDFRNSVLASYENRCAISGVSVPSLLVASHIIPWSVNESRRADPRNDVCLNSLYDKAFDRGLVTFSDDLKVVISPVLRAQSPSQFHQWALLDIEGASLNLPARFAPDPIDWLSIANMSFRVRDRTNDTPIMCIRTLHIRHSDGFDC